MRAMVFRLMCGAALGATNVAVATAQSPDQHMPMPPQSLAEWAKDAQRFPGLGTFHRKITTRSPLAQRYFDQGMRFIWAFNHDEATRSFAKAAQIDPTCASCYWGVALTLGPNYNMPLMAEARARVGWTAVQKATANARHATPVERALIAAVAKRFSGPHAVDPSNSAPLLKSYVGAMRGVAARYSRDADVQTMFAEGLMNTNPWKLWNADGTAGAATPEILAVLRRAMALQPLHPGANHYWIHAVEASPDPGQALKSALRLRGMMPAAGHLEHMPAHVMQRVGRYEEAAEANRKGAAADLVYLNQTAPPDYYPMYLIHNFQFLASSAAMEGRGAETVSALRTALAHMPEPMLLAMPGLDWSAGYLYDGLVRFGRWEEMLKEAPPSPKLVGQTISYLQARATALAATGRADEARAPLAAAAVLIAAVPAEATQGFNAASDVYAIGQLKARARIASATGRHDDAIGLLRQAAAKDDKLAYNEPRDMFFPVAHLLGAELVAAGKAADAEAVYRDDLKRYPNDGWALFGLGRAMSAQGRTVEAAAAMSDFDRAWHRADVTLAASAF
jgi:tetratricopeptide (TPR) repeat protein